ncbi:MAG: hypothetical protein UT86_C0006G0014 [Candidatus Magasanikbacteria bacterium GW2011_GWC2_40_17]|uniref:Uncharacterized protein n=1 Tax=Candidatus Magasanikbacteria bacterium GW2011_GWA2_42_32 TaxID=1619039 RepID=A0A0G1D3T1_9BACT|nr:MAG: hypothetical protein UT86_C0006G0014 [Candidatus Magasanikbacteria bacterium GW2011_GWC2_40_17]KKS56638.1 MAG: hypothetical protein UV20_C0008G0014 [Candidatus Magasanikbacteria bacterium GW2011_GWA2_42_32]OGH86097.1 MAG: hypothetical protein A2294_04105 [Candidatus Magasanikbacteria bacterium RIFOXYB2_FULL_38_10]
MAAYQRKVNPTEEDYRLARIVSDSLRRLSSKKRGDLLKDTVLQALTAAGYNTPDERSERYRGIMSVMGQHGGWKNRGVPRKKKPKKGDKTTAKTSLWPDVRPDMTPEERDLAQLRRDQMTGEALTLARLRRDDLAREADGE